MSFSTVDFPVFDADHHLYETAESFTRHLPKKYEGVIRYIDIKGRTKIAIRNHISDYIPNPTFEVVARPGAHMEFFAGRNTEGKTLREMTGDPMRSIPAFREPGAHLEMIDDMGIDATLVFPTMASLLEVNMMDDPELTLAVVHAFNEWLHEDWGFNHKDRIFTTPVLNPSIPERAIEELDWVLERGARVVLIRPAPVAGPRHSRSPFLKEFDPFWARVEESGLLVALHTSNSGYNDYTNDWEGVGEEFQPFKPTPFRLLNQGHRAVTDAIFSAVGHGMLSRFPGVRIATVENGSEWVPQAMKDLAHVYGKMPNEFAEDPIEVVRRQVFINPFWEDPLDVLVDAVGVDNVLFGSDWPHPEGLADPVGWIKHCEEAGFVGEDARKIMGGNLARLMNVELART